MGASSSQAEQREQLMETRGSKCAVGTDLERAVSG